MVNKNFKFLYVFIVTFIFTLNQTFILYASETSVKKFELSEGLKAENFFYGTNYNKAAVFFEYFRKKQDKNYALWNNQLGSIYLTKQNLKKALDAFLGAYYLMNDIEAFSKLEKSAISLSGAESEKAYKGDPYEKVFNALYVSLLLYSKGDLENALAVVKNGILCDSDVKKELYQSDVFILYLLAARLELMKGNNSSAEKYFNKAVEVYRLTHPLNRFLVSEEQAKNILLKEKQKELKEILDSIRKEEETEETENKGNIVYSPKKEKNKKIEKLKLEISKIKESIKKLKDDRKKNNFKIDISSLEKFKNVQNNTLLCVEFGRGPLKYQIGQYGQMGVFTKKPSEVENIKVFLDNKQDINTKKQSLNCDPLYQAITRGGRMMDGILKGQAKFKKTTADLSVAFRQASQQMIQTANQQAAANPYANTSGSYVAAGAVAVVSLIMAISSEMANPTADIRHWSLLPGNIIVVPVSLPIGKHTLKIELNNQNGQCLNSSDSEFEVKIKKENHNVIFKRFLSY